MAIRTLRNPRFQDESLSKLSWTRVVRDKFPYRHRTVCCSELARKNDIVITVPIVQDGTTLATAVIHQRCMAKFFATVPVDLDVTQFKAEKIISRFRKQNE